MSDIYDSLDYFTPEEVLSPDGLALRAKGHVLHAPEPLLKLAAFRHILNVPIQCNHSGKNLRGWRSPAENYSIYWKTYRPHRHTYHSWCAFDLTPVGMDLWEFFKEAIEFGWRGIYIDVDQNFVHVDYRPGSRWIAKRTNGKFSLVTV